MNPWGYMLRRCRLQFLAIDMRKIGRGDLADELEVAYIGLISAEELESKAELQQGLGILFAIASGAALLGAVTLGAQ